MSKWREQPIYIWFSDKYDTGDENCLPYNPEHFYIHSTTNNEEMDMLKGAVSIKKLPKLLQYEPIESFFAHPDIYRYMRSKDGEDWSPDEWVDFFQSAIDKKKTLELTVTGINWVDEVTVEDFQYGKKAGVEKDTYFTLQIKQFKKPIIKTESIVVNAYIPPSENTTNMPGIVNAGFAGGAPKNIQNYGVGADAYMTGGVWGAVMSGLSNPYSFNPENDYKTNERDSMLGVENVPVKYSVIGEGVIGISLSGEGQELKNQLKKDAIAQHGTGSYSMQQIKQSLIKSTNNDGAVVSCFETFCKERYGTSSGYIPYNKLSSEVDLFVESLISTSDRTAAKDLALGGSVTQTKKAAIDISKKYTSTSYKKSYNGLTKDTIVQATTQADIPTALRYNPLTQTLSPSSEKGHYIPAGTTVYTPITSIKENSNGKSINSSILDKAKAFFGF